MVNPVAKQTVVDAAVDHDGVPHFLVHVVAGLHTVVSLAQINGQLGIAFHVEAEGGIEGHQGEHFVEDLKNKGLRAERHGLGNAGFGKTVGAEFFYVHAGGYFGENKYKEFMSDLSDYKKKTTDLPTAGRVTESTKLHGE